MQTKTTPVKCSTNAVVTLTEGTTPISLTISGAANDSGLLAQRYAAGATLKISVSRVQLGARFRQRT